MSTFHKHILKEVLYLKQYICMTTIYSGGSQALEYTGFRWLSSFKLVAPKH